MKELLDILTPFLVGLGSIAVIVVILFFCAWFLSNDEDL